MRKVKIKGSDEVVEFPDGMSTEEMRQALLQKYSMPRSMEQNVSDALTPPQASAQPYEPSMAERMKDTIANYLIDSGLVSDRFGAQQIGENLSMVLGAAPVVGDAQAGDEFGRAAAGGDIAGMAMAGVGAVPVVGDAAKAGARTLNDKLQAKIDSDWMAAFKEYAGLKETDGGRLINTDEARELSDEYRMDRTKAGEVHQASSAFTKQIYDKLLKEQTPIGREPIVRFMAGGAGAGKSTALKTGNKFDYDPDITYDTTLSKGAADAKKIDKALETGRDAEIVHVYRDPIEAFENGVLKRGKNKDKPNGRIVPMREVAKNHVGARESINYMLDRYGDDNRVKIALFDNSRGQNNGDFVDDISELPEMNYTADELEAQMKEVLDRKFAEGYIDEQTYNQYLGK